MSEVPNIFNYFGGTQRSVSAFQKSIKKSKYCWIYINSLRVQQTFSTTLYCRRLIIINRVPPNLFVKSQDST